MDFDLFVGIDWSGSKTANRGIQVAVCSSDNEEVSLIDLSNRRWTRSLVSTFIQELVKKRRALIGFDFAFAYPYCDVERYFPGYPQSPSNGPSLWSLVDQVCESAPDFYGGDFYKNPGAPFAEYLLYQTYRGELYQERFRVTEQRCRELRTSPESVFKCVGPKQVGPGSVAGMRLLHKLSTQRVARIWPFDSDAGNDASVIVEIFPQVFLSLAGVNRPVLSKAEQVQSALAFYQATLTEPLRRSFYTEDERDALVSTAALRHLAQGPSLWRPDGLSPRVALTEGWIYGAT